MTDPKSRAAGRASPRAIAQSETAPKSVKSNECDGLGLFCQHGVWKPGGDANCLDAQRPRYRRPCESKRVATHKPATTTPNRKSGDTCRLMASLASPRIARQHHRDDATLFLLCAAGRRRPRSFNHVATSARLLQQSPDRLRKPDAQGGRLKIACMP